MNKPTVRFKLEEVLKEKGVTQTQMADDLGIRRSTVTGMKKATSLNLEYLAQIMSYLKLTSLDEILEYTPAEGKGD